MAESKRDGVGSVVMPPAAISTHDHAARRREMLCVALLVLVTIIAALGWVFSMMALKGLSPLYFIGIRFGLAGLGLGCLALPQLRRLRRRDWIQAVVPGFFLGVAMVSWIEGLHLTDNIGVGAFIGALGNILAPIVGRILFRWRLAPATWAAVAVATVGMACLSLQRGLSLSLADLFFLGSALGSSLNLNFNTRYSSRIPILPLTAVQLVVVGLFSLLTALPVEPVPTMPGGETIGWLAASILIATALRFFLQVKGQSLAPVSHTALILTLEPVWTALIAVVWLGTAMSASQTAGCLLIFAALLVNRWDLFRDALTGLRPAGRS
jgi:drug/metabolite transporter (DMT)-like permease